MMTPTQLDDLVPWMAQKLPGCQDAVMIQALHDAFRIFCQRSEWFRPPIDINVLSQQTNYRLNPSSFAHIRRIAGVYWRTPDLIASKQDGILLTDAVWKVIEEDGGIYTLVLSWQPGANEQGGLRVKPVLVPVLGCDQPPPVPVLERWGDALAWCAVYELAGQPGKKYSSDKMEAKAAMEFSRAIAHARKQNLAGLMSQDQTSQPLMPVGYLDPWLPTVS